jgi:hypothetical protein
MVRRFIFTPEERLDILKEGEHRPGTKIMTIYKDEECRDVVDKLGSLEKNAFSITSPWVVQMSSSGYGLAYMYAIKENQIDFMGEKANYIFYFYHHLRGEGLAKSKEMEDHYFHNLEEGVKKVVDNVTKIVPVKVISTILPLTPWMFKELEDVLFKK